MHLPSEQRKVAQNLEEAGPNGESLTTFDYDKNRSVCDPKTKRNRGDRNSRYDRSRTFFDGTCCTSGRGGLLADGDGHLFWRASAVHAECGDITIDEALPVDTVHGDLVSAVGALG